MISSIAYEKQCHSNYCLRIFKSVVENLKKSLEVQNNKITEDGDNFHDVVRFYENILIVNQIP